jgi:hypothetical protein
MWHAQPTRLTLRFIRPPGSFEGRSEPDAVAQVDLRSDGTAFVHAAKTHPELSVSEWRGLVRLLRRDWGVTQVEYERRLQRSTLPVSRV